MVFFRVKRNTVLYYFTVFYFIRKIKTINTNVRNTLSETFTVLNDKFNFYEDICILSDVYFVPKTVKESLRAGNIFFLKVSFVMKV